MPRPSLEVADIFRAHGAAWRKANAGHLSLGQLKVMSAIERCRTAALGGHVARCEDCGHEHVAYNSCRNRHCPKCQSFAKEKWLAAREQELLPVPYFHTVFTLPHELNPWMLTNLRPGVDLLFHSAAQTLLTFGRNELGATLGFLALLHTWDQQLRAHFHLEGPSSND